MSTTTATPMKPARRWLIVLQLAAGCLLVALFVYGCTLLMDLGVPAVFAFVLPSLLATFIVRKFGG